MVKIMPVWKGKAAVLVQVVGKMIYQQFILFITG
jgi:hypothetical protein